MTDKAAEEAMRTDEDWRNYVAEELRKGAVRMDSIQEDITANTNLTSELLDIFNACKGGFKVLGWIGIAIKWLGMVAGGATAVVIAWHKWGVK